MYIDASIFLFVALKQKHLEASREIQELTRCWDALNKILSLNITILDVPGDFRLVMNTCREHKLLTRDALHVAVMETHGISHIATGDADFKRVPEITVWMPSLQ